jgi:hypothetical protein
MNLSSRKTLAWASVCAAITCVALALAAEGSPKEAFSQVKIPKVDEGERKPDFVKFREQMLGAIRARNLKFLLSHIDPAISYSFGEEFGLQGFIEQWKLKENPEKSPLWDELDRLLRLGGVFTDEAQSFFIAPYTFINFPSFINASEFSLVLVENTPIYAAPDRTSPVIALASQEVVKWKYKPGTADLDSFEEVVIYTGARGFVQRKYLRSPIDYRAGFQDQNGTWKMMFMVNGD